MSTIAELGIRVDSQEAAGAAEDLNRLTQAGTRAEQSAASLMGEMQALERSLAAGAKSTQGLAQQRESLAKLTQAGAYSEAEFAKITGQLDKQQAALVKSTQDEQKALNSLLGAIDPSRAALAKLDSQVEELGKHLDAGRISQEQYNTALKKIDGKYAEFEKTGSAISSLGLNTKAARENVLQLGNALAEGNLRVAAHNFLEIGANAGVSALRIAAIAAPIGAAAAALGALALGYAKGSAEAVEFNKSLALTGNYAGTTSSALGAMAKQVGVTVGTTGAAADVLAQLAGSGKIVSSSFEHIAVAALSFEKATGKAASETVNEFVKLADDPVKAVVALNDKYNFLTAAVYTQIRALQEQGDTLGAQQLAESSYADALIQRADTITSNLGTVESAWNSVKGAAKGAWDAILDIGREETFDQKFEKLADRLNTLRNAKSTPMILGDNPDMMMLSRGESGAQSDITALLQKEVDDQAAARRKMFQDLDIQAGTKAYEALQKTLDATASKSTKLTKALEENRRSIASARQAGYTFTAAEEAALEKQTRDKFKDPKTAATQVDLTAFNDAKNNLAGIVNEYKNAQKQLDAAQKAGLISQADYALKREALIGNERDEVTAAYEAEIAALEAAKGKKSTTAAQSIQIDQKIADARAAMLKAQKDYDSEQQVLATNEKGRLDKQTLAVESYTAALQAQVDTLRQQGLRAAGGLGLGDRQRALQDQQNAIDDRINQQKLDLANQYGDGSRGMSFEEYRQKLQALEASQQKLHDTTIANYDDMTAAQGDWRAGATSAWQNYLESARDVAGQTKSLFTNAFSSMEDAIVNFAMTGKLSFADFARSVLADMARIAARQAASSALSSIFGMASSALGAYFGGGAGNGLAAGSAGATSSSLGASSAGYSSAYFQANGGAWSNGVQLFADGGAFTNGIVSKPTEFGMANGKLGVMGEAGDEAIMPLTRTAGGQLGVRAVGGGSSGGTLVQINAPITIEAEDRSQDGMQLDQAALQKNMQVQMRAAAEKAVADSWRPGGTSYMASKGR